MNIAQSAKHPQRRLYTHLKIQTEKTDSKAAIQCEPNLNSTTSLDQKLRHQQHWQHEKKNTIQDQSGIVVGAARFLEGFERIGKLGEGAHTCVYQYMDRKNRLLYAGKVFKGCDYQRVRDIKQSFRIMKAVDHPCVIKAYNLYINQQNSNCYLLTQICHFKDLRCFMETEAATGNKISEQRVANIMYQILIALNYFKEKGICHRDIKPENILYDPLTGNIKIIDFQLSRMKKYDDQTFEMWTYTGSLYYRAPQSFVLGYSETIDMWAAGIVAYQLLTGTLPFTSTSIKDVTEDIMSKQIDFDIHPISRQSKKFLKSLLRKDPKKRSTPNEALTSPFLLKSHPKSPKLQLKTNSETYAKKFEYVAEKPEFRDQNISGNFNEGYRRGLKRSRSSFQRKMRNK